MKLICSNPKQSLNKAYLKQRITRNEIELFKTNLITLLNKIKEIEQQPRDESEEHLKNNLRDFLLYTYYKSTNVINTKDKIDLVIHLGMSTNDDVGVIIEAKRPSNTGEMLSEINPNRKSIHELILYYLNQRIIFNNNQLKYLVATNINEWYIFDANYFDKYIYRNSQIKKLYDSKINEKKDNPFFYEEIAKILTNSEIEIPCVYFDIRKYDTILRNPQNEDDKDLIALYKILSPQHLLKIPSANDSNSLNQNFYKELLHIIGLEEVKEGGKNIIRRKKDNPNQASLIELAIDSLLTEDVFHRIPDISIYGEKKEERVFNIALELCLTWINRILFLKLLEGQLISYHNGNKDYKFLNSEKIKDFDELFNLFHRVLAIDFNSRKSNNKLKYSKIPYLNSSLFEISELEDNTIKINTLENNEELELINATVLKDIKGTKNKLPILEYLFKFLDAFDFASEGVEDIQEDTKTLINASVLGKVFEKINGYKDGSIFTPGFITMYMCRQSIRMAVMQKFKDKYGWNIEQFDDIKNYLADRKSTKDILEFNDVINSLRICDPAVGSGHFLVSALNEIIAIKYELGLLADNSGTRIRDYEIIIENDELIITNHNGDIFEYKIKNGKPLNNDIQRLQKTLFHEKQTIIESCLFGVDINPNSVKICRLRLWIELLKNAYYKDTEQAIDGEMQLETLPNIDINIKYGNSLLSRFALDADLSKALKSIKYNIESYRGFVSEYKNVKSREVKRGLQVIINSIKGDFRSEINKNDPKVERLYKLSGELSILENQSSMFDLNEKEKKELEKKKNNLKIEITKISNEIEDIKSNVIYKNAFEWRFEFPEVLDDNGNFIGFDIMIGNPPYIQLQSMGKETDYLSKANYETFIRSGDIYALFIEKGIQILNKKGYISFIISNKWMRAGYGEKLRDFIANKTSPLQLIDFCGYKVFESASVDSNILITSKLKDINNEFYACSINSDFEKDTSIQNYYLSNKQLMPQMTKESLVIFSNIELHIYNKIKTLGTPLKNWNIKINYGIKTGLNEAFIIDGKKKDEMISLEPQSVNIIKPILRGRDIKRYKAEFADLWLIFIPWHFPLHRVSAINGASQKAEDEFKKQYPIVYNHLLNNKDSLSARNRAETGIRYEWYALQRCANTYLEDFEKNKIIYPDIMRTPKDSKLLSEYPYFFLDKNRFYVEATNFFMIGNNLNFIMSVLCSKLGVFAFTNFYSGPHFDDKGFRYKKAYLENFPIPKISEVEQQFFINIVDIILAKKENNEDTSQEEREIDMLVYNLYDLTEEEIRIVEG